jgi:hypothetical protein
MQEFRPDNQTRPTSIAMFVAVTMVQYLSFLLVLEDGVHPSC